VFFGELIPVFGMVTTIIMMSIVGKVIIEWRRAGQSVQPRDLAQIDARLQRIEQAVDAMSIEVERISEGQRFTTKLLADRSAAASPSAR
jgi:hypothetical protein